MISKIETAPNIEGEPKKASMMDRLKKKISEAGAPTFINEVVHS